MSEFSANPAAPDPGQPPPASAFSPGPSSSEPPPPPAAPKSRAGLPSWLPYFLLAAIPALIVGVIVYAVGGGGGGGGGSGDAAGVIDGLFRLNGEGVQSFENQTPPGLPKDLPQYPGSKIVVSFLVRSDQGASYIVIYQTSSDTKKVLDFYQESLDKEPWQVESGVSSTDVNGVFFSRPDDADVQGTIQVSNSKFNSKTTIYLSYDDVTPSGSAPSDNKFVLPSASLGLPSTFPNDIPIYRGKDESTVTAVQFQRGAGSTMYVVTFLTRNADVDVIDFYRKEFLKRGWQVTDGTPRSTRDFAISIDFQDSSAPAGAGHDPRRRLRG